MESPFKGYRLVPPSQSQLVSPTSFDPLWMDWSSYYEQQVHWDLSEYQEPSSSSLSLLREVQSSLLNEMFDPLLYQQSWSKQTSVSPKHMRQTAMRILSCLIDRNPKLKEESISERFPSPLSCLWIGAIFPIQYYRNDHELPQSPHTVEQLLKHCPSKKAALFGFYSHRPSLLAPFGADEPLIQAMWEIKAAQLLLYSSAFRSSYIYGKHQGQWFAQLIRSLYQEHTGLLTALFAQISLQHQSVSFGGYTLLKEKVGLDWPLSAFSEGTAFQRFLQSSCPTIHDNQLEHLSFSQISAGLAFASTFLEQSYAQCSTCFTLFSPFSPSTLSSRRDLPEHCPVCSGFYHLIKKRYQNSDVGDEEKAAVKSILHNLSFSKNSLIEISPGRLLQSYSILHKLHAQSWPAYKKLSYRAESEVKRSVLQENFLDSLWLYKYQQYLPSPLQSTEWKEGKLFFKYSPWSRAFFSKMPRTLQGAVESFLFYLTFPFPPSSLFSYKTFGAPDAHLEAVWRGAFFAQTMEEYKKVSLKWPAEIFRAFHMHQYNPYYPEEKVLPVQSLQDSDEILQKWLQRPFPQEKDPSLATLQERLKLYLSPRFLSYPEKKSGTFAELHMLCDELIKRSEYAEIYEEFLQALKHIEHLHYE